MTAVNILQAQGEHQDTLYWAFVPGEGRRTSGATAGEALDALMRQLGPDKTSQLVVRRFGPDEYFSQAQVNRLNELMALSKTGLTPEEEAERDALVEAEFLASAQRTSDLADALGR